MLYSSKILASEQHPTNRMTGASARGSLTSNPALPSKRSYHEMNGSSNPENPFAGAFQESKRRKIAKAESTSNYVAKFRKALNPFRGTCPICRVRGLHNIPDHQLSKCDILWQMTSPTDFITFKRSIKYGKHHKHSICFYCHIPQINDRLHQTFELKGNSCEFPDTIAAVAMHVLYDKHVRKEACAYFACKWSDDKDYVVWLNGPPSEGHYSRISEVFLWFSEMCTTSTLRE
jgi:hypothetical protein